MPPALKKKIGPLPVWGWAGAVMLGVVILYMRSRSPAAATTDPNAALGDTGTGAFGPIDPNTGIPYSFEAPQGGGTATAPTAFDEVSDVAGIVGALRDAGLIPDNTAAGKAKKKAKKDTKAAKSKRRRQSHPRRAKSKGVGRATSTGAASSAGGHPHTASPHPKHRAKPKTKKMGSQRPGQVAPLPKGFEPPPRRPAHHPPRRAPHHAPQRRA